MIGIRKGLLGPQRGLSLSKSLVQRRNRHFSSQRGTSASSSTTFSRFALDWNETIDRRPQEVLVSFLACQGTTWLFTYQSLFAMGLQLPPDLAAGWFVARVTRKFVQPVNLGLAAGMTKAFPVLSTFQITPLITGFAKPDPALTKEFNKRRAALEKQVPFTKPILNAVRSGAQWLQGPVDRYGLSFFLTGKVTFLFTMSSAAAAIQQGVDLESLLTGWGLSSAAQGVAGTVAASSVGNLAFVPLHFYAAVRGVKGIEAWAQTWNNAYHVVMAEKDDPEYNSKSSEEKDKEDKKREDGILNYMTLILVFWSLGITLYGVRLMGKKVAEGDGSEKKARNSRHNREYRDNIQIPADAHSTCQ